MENYQIIDCLERIATCLELHTQKNQITFDRNNDAADKYQENWLEVIRERDLAITALDSYKIINKTLRKNYKKALVDLNETKQALQVQLENVIALQKSK